MYSRKAGVEMNPLRVGVIGYGYWGPNLTRNFQELPLAELVAVSDLKEERLQQARSKHLHIVATTNYQELFDLNLDAVVVATPPATHHRIARECLEHGLNVLVEKPIALRSQDAEDLVQLADSNDLVLMVGHTFQYNSAMFTLKQLIDSGELGKIYYVDAARLNLGLFQRDSNVLWDLAPHDISILLFLLGENPVSVSAQGMCCVFDGMFDIAYVNLLFPGNIPAFVHVSWLDPCKVRRITVVGSKKMAVLNDVENEQKIKIYDKGVDMPEYTNGFEEFQCNYRSGDIVIPKIRFLEPLRQECQVFVERCLGHQHGNVLPTDDFSLSRQLNLLDQTCTICAGHDAGAYSCGREGVRVIKILEAAQHSMCNGHTAETIQW